MRGIRISAAMATRNVANVPNRPEKCTEFQLHASGDDNIIDFTERKLLAYAARVSDAQQRLTLMAMVDDYRKGHIAVAWRRGSPLYFRVTKDV